jgi:hypothetical protein
LSLRAAKSNRAAWASQGLISCSRDTDAIHFSNSDCLPPGAMDQRERTHSQVIVAPGFLPATIRNTVVRLSRKGYRARRVRHPGHSPHAQTSQSLGPPCSPVKLIGTSFPRQGPYLSIHVSASKQHEARYPPRDRSSASAQELESQILVSNSQITFSTFWM